LGNRRFVQASNPHECTNGNHLLHHHDADFDRGHVLDLGDPTGPVSSASGRKVTRGGAFDNTQQSCRSAARSLFNAGPFDTDTDLGFRVVLVTESQ
jgi:formylglycine-generating enzyme required for sulfatase activity